MATSGIYAFSLSLNQVLLAAYELGQWSGDGETLNGNMQTYGKQQLNLMLKHWQSQGIHLWTYEEGTLFLTVGQAEYKFGDATTNLANNFFETTLSVAAVATATTITVTDASDILNTDKIGIIQEDNNIFFTTVNGAPAGNVVTLTDPLPKAANLGAFVRNYRATPAFVPVTRVLSVRRRDNSDNEIPIVFKSREDYFDLPNKEQQGIPIQAYYSRLEPQGTMFLWTTPSSSTPIINFTYERQIQIMDELADTLDVPEWAQEAVIYNLAVRLIPKFGTSAESANILMGLAKEKLNDILSFDSAVYPVTMDMEQYG